MNKRPAKEERPKTDEEIIRESWGVMPVADIAAKLKQPFARVLDRVTYMNQMAALRALERKLKRTRGPKAITSWQRRQINVLRKRTSLFKA